MPSATLERHPDSPRAALRGIQATLTRDPRGLKIRFHLEGDVAKLRIPAPRPPRVADRLWQHTCCEVFLRRDAESGYREFNLSPSGEWAAYEFARYRDGAPLAVPDPGIVVRRDSKRVELEALIDLRHHDKLHVGLSAVVEEESGELSYWALRHAPGKPDFHHADAFAMELD
jgi:hypothetical protein